MRAIWLALLLTACESGELTPPDDTGLGSDTDRLDTGDLDTDTPTDTSDTSDTSEGACGATIYSTSPRAGATNVPVSKIITVRFTNAVEDGEWSIAVQDVTGSASLASNGLSATFTASQDYETDRTYTVTVTVCGRTTTYSFTTATGPLQPEAVADQTYVIPWDDLNWVQPASLGNFSSLADVDFLLVHIAGMDTQAQTIDIVGSLGDVDPNDASGAVQAPCTKPFAFPQADFSGNPVLEVGPTRLSFDMGGSQAAIDDAYVKAVFVEDGDAMVEIEVSGQLDTKPLSDALSINVCSNPYLSLPCVQCAAQPDIRTCVDVLLTADRAEADPDLTFDPTLDPSTVPACN